MGILFFLLVFTYMVDQFDHELSSIKKQFKQSNNVFNTCFYYNLSCHYHSLIVFDYTFGLPEVSFLVCMCVFMFVCYFWYLNGKWLPLSIDESYRITLGDNKLRYKYTKEQGNLPTMSRIYFFVNKIFKTRDHNFWDFILFFFFSKVFGWWIFFFS